MRIFSNFDTKLKSRTFQRYQRQYWADKVVLITKSRLFWFVKVFFPLFIFLLSSGALAWGFFFLLGEDVFIYVVLPVWIFGVLVLLYPIIWNYIEYKLDFTVITPRLVLTYDQKGIFKRHIKTINSDNVKTVSIMRAGFLYSVCNNWDLLFLSEWGEVEYWEITLRYVFKPEKRRHMIAQVLWRV